jgi:NAD(P)-dependent dehydrogenase (short-subunit alcohol dehydrogenase family)
VVDQALDRFGRIDTLVNNAGIYIGKPFTDYTLDDYLAITAVNLTGFFHMTQRTIPQMINWGGGHIVNISTSLVERADRTRPAALVALTKRWARRGDPVAGHRIRVARSAGERGLARRRLHARA